MFSSLLPPPRQHVKARPRRNALYDPTSPSAFGTRPSGGEACQPGRSGHAARPLAPRARAAQLHPRHPGPRWAGQQRWRRAAPQRRTNASERPATLRHAATEVALSLWHRRGPRASPFHRPPTSMPQTTSRHRREQLRASRLPFSPRRLLKHTPACLALLPLGWPSLPSGLTIVASMAT